MKTMMIGLLALTTLSSSAFASTALYCGKQILTATGTDYPLGAGGDDDLPTGALSDSKVNWGLDVAGVHVTSDANVESKASGQSRTITVTQELTDGSGKKTLRTYQFSNISDANCSDSKAKVIAKVSESLQGAPAKTIAQFSCLCDID